MVERRQPTEIEIRKAWMNIAGNKTEAKCPYKYCKYPNSMMHRNNYGNQTNTSWVVDHKVALANGGTWNESNLQAMHNYCNNLKSDS